MMADVYNQDNKKTGTIDLPENVFGIKWNPDLVTLALHAQLANARKPVAHAKDRGEVRGGGRKPWRQKHTGRARHGSTRSPLWSGGGVAHGPSNERNFAKKISKKMKKSALFSVLSHKLKSDEIRVVDDLKMKARKTKSVAEIMRKFFGKKQQSALFIPENKNKDLFLAGRNLAGVKVLNPTSVNIYDCLRHKYVFIEKDAVWEIVKHYSGN